jgi:hypothetical protein
MRKLLVPFMVALLLPAATFAAQPSAQPPAANGTLSVREGRGIVQLSAKGSMTGRLRGRIRITDPNPYDSKRPVVYGATKTIYKSEKTVIYEGRNLRFRLIGSRYTVRLDGRAIFMSAIGRGQGQLDGEGNVAGGVFFDGVYSLNDEAYRSLPDDLMGFELAAPPPGDG